jgi:hypothetical protein
MKNKAVIYLIIAIAIILILAGGYLKFNYGNSYGLMFVGGIILLVLRYRE